MTGNPLKMATATEGVVGSSSCRWVEGWASFRDPALVSVLAKAPAALSTQEAILTHGPCPTGTAPDRRGLRRPPTSSLPLDRPLGKACLARLSWLCHWTLEGTAGRSWLSLGTDLCTNLPSMAWGSCRNHKLSGDEGKGADVCWGRQWKLKRPAPPTRLLGRPPQPQQQPGSR